MDLILEKLTMDLILEKLCQSLPLQNEERGVVMDTPESCVDI